MPVNNNFKQEKLFIVIGLLFLTTGIVFNEWVLAAMFSADSSIVISRKILIWIFEIVMIAAGLLFIVKRKVLSLKIILFYLAMSFFSVLAVEACLNIVFYAVKADSNEWQTTPTYSMPAFEGKDWAKEWFNERRDINIIYKPFRMWGNSKYEGKHINLDTEGHRRTWNPKDLKGKPGTIYMLGGSTMWGYGARDEYTIPSYVSKKLHDKGHDFQTFNFGEFAYTYPQDIITLILLLRDGHRPDYVITYDGINDVYSAYQAGEPGALSNQFLIHKRLENMDLSNTGHIKAVISNIFEEYSKIYISFKKLEQVINPAETQFQEVAHSYSDEQLKELGRGVVEDYTKSLALLDSLSKTYDFKYLSFWQPNAFTEDKLVEGEEAVDIRLGDESLRKLFRYTNEYIDAEQLPNFYNISDVLNGREEPYYFDWMHITEDGNRVVAENILRKFKKEFLTDKK